VQLTVEAKSLCVWFLSRVMPPRGPPVRSKSNFLMNMASSFTTHPEKLGNKSPVPPAQLRQSNRFFLLFS